MTTSVSCYSVFTYRITWIVGKVFYWFFSILSELEDAVSQTWTKTQTSKWDDIYQMYETAPKYWEAVNVLTVSAAVQFLDE